MIFMSECCCCIPAWTVQFWELELNNDIHRGCSSCTVSPLGPIGQFWELELIIFMVATSMAPPDATNPYLKYLRIM